MATFKMTIRISRKWWCIPLIRFMQIIGRLQSVGTIPPFSEHTKQKISDWFASNAFVAFVGSKRIL